MGVWDNIGTDNKKSVWDNVSDKPKSVWDNIDRETKPSWFDNIKDIIPFTSHSEDFFEKPLEGKWTNEGAIPEPSKSVNDLGEGRWFKSEYDEEGLKPLNYDNPKQRIEIKKRLSSGERFYPATNIPTQKEDWEKWNEVVSNKQPGRDSINETEGLQGVSGLDPFDPLNMAMLATGVGKIGKGVASGLFKASARKAPTVLVNEIKKPITTSVWDNIAKEVEPKIVQSGKSKPIKIKSSSRSSTSREVFNDPIDRMESHVYNEIKKGDYTIDEYFADEKSGLDLLAEEWGLERQSGALTFSTGKSKSLVPIENQESEQLYQFAKGIKPDSFTDKVKTIAKEIKNKFTRTYEHLDSNDPKNSQLIFDLKRLEKQKNVIAENTTKNIGETLSGLNKSEYDVFDRKLFYEDLMSDVNKGLYNEKELPFKFTPESLNKELGKVNDVIKSNPKIQQALAKRQKMWDDFKADYVNALKPYKVGVEDMFKDNYYRHQVLDYIDNNGIFGTGKRLKAPTSRGYMKSREGYSGLYNTDYLESEHQIMSQMMHDAEVAKTLTKIKKTEDISGKIKNEYTAKLENLMESLGHTKEQLKYGMQQNDIPSVAYKNTLKSKINDLSPESLKKAGLDDWKKLIPEGYTVWQPKEGSVFYPAMTVPEETAKKILLGEINDITGIAGELKEVLAVGGKRPEWVVRQEVSDTLNNLTREKSKGIISSVDLGIMNAWKRWQLISPRRYTKYQLRNMSGDSEAVFIGNPSAFKDTPRAVKELWDVFVKKKEMPDDMKVFFDRGGMSGTLQAQEMDDLKQLWMYSRLYEKKGGVPNIWKTYWNKARITTDFRETILRYANFKNYKKQLIENNGIPKNYGASKPKMVDALKDINDKAYVLQNDLLGAYDNVSVAGQVIRERLIPFWSWNEVNFKRYIQLYRNAANDDKLTSAIGKKLGATTPRVALKVGRLAIKTAALTSSLAVYNNQFFPEEENELPNDIKKSPHIILGRDSEGRVQYFNRLGTLEDFTSWFGLDYTPSLVTDYIKGKKTLKEILQKQVENSAKAPIKKITGSAIPMTKMTYELATRRTVWPDIFKPGTIRDRALHLARSFGLENEYIAMAGLPSKGYTDTIKDAFMYKIDPGEAAYRDVYDLKNDFTKKLGKITEGFWLTPTGDAYYNMKLAVKYKDKEAFNKYFNILADAFKEQIKAGNIGNSITNIITSMHPLSGITATEQAMFMSKLDAEDKEKVQRAIEFYKNNLANIKEMNFKLNKEK